MGIDSISFAQTATPSVATPTIQNNTVTRQGNNQKKRPRINRKRLTQADSLKLIAQQQDSLQRLVASNTSGSAFNIGQPNNNVQATPAPPVAPTPTQETTPITVQKSDNPFDIVNSSASTSAESTTSSGVKKDTASAISTISNIASTTTSSRNFLFWLFFVVLVLMALVVANARGAIQNAYSAVLNDSALRQIYKEPIGWGNLSYLALYILSWVSVSIFAFLLFNHYGIKLPYSKGTLFFFCLLTISGLFLLRHAVLYILANVFPINKEVRTYSFILMTAGILTGLLLMPFNIFIAFSPTELSGFFVYGALGIIVITYLVRSLRGLTVATPFLMDNKFHFLLYLCTVEFAPLLVFAKFLLKYS